MPGASSATNCRSGPGPSHDRSCGSRLPMAPWCRRGFTPRSQIRPWPKFIRIQVVPRSGTFTRSGTTNVTASYVDLVVEASGRPHIVYWSAFDSVVHYATRFDR